MRNGLKHELHVVPGGEIVLWVWVYFRVRIFLPSGLPVYSHT